SSIHSYTLKIYTLSLHDALPIYGYRRSVEMCDEYDIYRQCYCGCVFAAKQQGIDFAQITKDAKAFMEGKDAEKSFPHIRFTYEGDRKSTRLNSSHVSISYAVFCL